MGLHYIQNPPQLIEYTYKDATKNRVLRHSIMTEKYGVPFVSKLLKSDPYTYEALNLHMEHLLIQVEHSIYIWSTPFTYRASPYTSGALHLHMEHPITYVASPYTSGVLYLHMENPFTYRASSYTSEALHLHMEHLHIQVEHSLYIWSISVYKWSTIYIWNTHLHVELSINIRNISVEHPFYLHMEHHLQTHLCEACIIN